MVMNLSSAKINNFGFIKLMFVFFKLYLCVLRRQRPLVKHEVFLNLLKLLWKCQGILFVSMQHLMFDLMVISCTMSTSGLC